MRDLNTSKATYAEIIDVINLILALDNNVNSIKAFH